METEDKLNTAQVMAAIDALELHLRSLTGSAAEGTTARLQELAALRTDNRNLKQQQKEATKRLDQLIQKFEHTS